MVAAGSITVAIRKRPPTSWEAARLPEPCYDSSFRGEGALSAPGRTVMNSTMLRDVVQIVDDRIITFDPAEQDRSKAFMERGFVPPGTKRYKDRRFMFDRVFDHTAMQQDVYEGTAQPLLQGLLDGFNATVFAYGATGCGKTHTISGTDNDPGIIYLTMSDLFQRIEDRKADWNVEVVVTFLEIYNEEIRDLLVEPGTVVPRGGLCIREDKAVKVVGLVELKPKSAEEVKSIVLQGNLRRTQSPTHANETSSRSHAVLQVHVTQSPRTASISEQRTMGTLSIIDLAGSERAAATTNMGQRMIEGANINKSLLALGNCINALCESAGGVRHVPYRNSKLTRLLKFSLGGNCKTVMIVCIAPTSNHFEDTHNTLVYAERATKIKTKVVTRNVLNVNRHVGQYVEAINRLNLEISELKAKLSGKNNTEMDIVRRKKAEADAEILRSQNDMKSRAEQTRPSIIDGAACNGHIAVAQAKLSAINRRIADIDCSPDSNDLRAERALLESLAAPEQVATKSSSTLVTRLQKASNSRALVDATLRAMTERRSEKLDEANMEVIRLDAKRHRAEIEAAQAEEENKVLKDAVQDMAQVMVGLVGMLGRCTVVVGDAAQELGSPPSDGSAPTSQRVSALLQRVKENNDEIFISLVGHSTREYASIADAPKSIDTFAGYNTSFSRRISSAPVAPATANVSSSNKRRSDAYGALGSSPRRTRSPRKSLRSSLASQPYRRTSDKDKKGGKVTKNVQWRDEVGHGDLEDGSPRINPAVNIVPASPVVDSPQPSSVGSSFSGSTSSRPPSQRNNSLAGSESEWEDENEKTDDSLNISISAPLLTNGRSYGSLAGSSRPRPSRLDPSFLKSRSKLSSLGSLAEDDESSPERHVSQPLSDRMNLSASMSSAPGRRKLSIGDQPRSPARRVASTPRHPQSVTKARRRSNVGPMRLEKGRRRSSMIPQLSPPDKSRRVPGSPGKRVRRLSAGKSAAPKQRAFLPANDVSSGDMSFSRLRPTWK